MAATRENVARGASSVDQGAGHAPRTTSYAPRLLLRLSWRHILRRPMQSALLVIGVAIGVAMIVAIDLANGAASRAFALGTETIAGRATHQIVGGPNGLDEQVYTRLRRELGFRNSAPVVESYVLVDELDAQPLRLLGVDPFAEAPFRSYLGASGASSAAPENLDALMVRPNTVLLSASLADRYGLTSGEFLQIGAASGLVPVEIVGLLEPADDLSRRALDGLLIADIATAQELLDRVGTLDHIDLILEEGAAGAAQIERLQTILPPGARIDPTSASDGVVSDMTRAFGLNLTALSLLALVVGMFLIYNTITFSVLQRRQVLGSLRALGMTRREVYALILLETLVLGLIGAAAGLALGVLLGRGAVQLVSQTINDLFFVVSVREVDIPASTLVKGAGIGILAALIGALLPAYEATNAPPAGALTRSDVEDRSRRALPWVSGAALLALGSGVALLVPEWSLVVSFVGLFLVIIGAALLTPLLTLVLMRIVQRLVGRAGLLARMAPRYIVRALSRVSVATAALMVAVSVIVGVGIMIGSFRTTVELWLEDILQADIYITVPTLSGSRALATMDSSTVEWLAAQPGIERVATSRSVEVTAWLAGGDDEPLRVRLLSLSEDLAGRDRRYRASIGDYAETWRALESGGLTINEPMANRFGVAVGDTLFVQTDQGRREFPVVGVAVDFDVNAVAFIHDSVYRAFWNDDQYSALGLMVAPGVRVDEKVAQLRTAAQDSQSSGKGILIQSNRGTRQNAMEVFDRTFAITVALQLLAALVAFIGILSTLMSLQLERTREIGVLRANGMTVRQLWRLSLMETGLIGASAGLFAIPTGLALAAILIYIINLRSFGWTLEMRLQPADFTQAFAVAIGAALLAGLYPAWRIGRTQPASALRSE